ncbi:response regulator [Noviherbaspirillum pedocola]|uniref:Response regulator n=1 Tax=Noviherbaspirillum pedocola TaxID=2801341 RepID=A0A934SN79_9BURK|nr:response regulator [Noviherbaspirillum pedocola]MBK4733560.1 response regulator [Noviherbaspirillum pedocola]
MAVLIIDDDPLNLTLMSYLLRTVEPAPALEFADPLAALAWCAAQAPDLVLIDQWMPGLCGLEFIERLRQLPQGANVPVLLISADVDAALRGKGESLGVADFLSKPIVKAELLEKVQKLLRR